MNKKIVVFIHLGNHSLWNEINSYLHNFKDHTDGYVSNRHYIEFDLYVNLVQEINSDEEIEKQKNIIIEEYPNVYITISPNKGFDIGGKFYSIKQMYLNKKEYDIGLFLQTKSDNTWRQSNFNALLGSYERIKEIINSDFNMIGDKTYYNRHFQLYNNNLYHLTNLTNKLNIFSNNLLKTYKFCAGTMFWYDMKLIEKYFPFDKIDEFIDMLNNKNTPDHNWKKINKHIGLKYNNILDCKEKCIRDGMIEHAFERLFGYIVDYEKGKVIVY